MIHLLNALDVVNWDSVMIDNQKKLCLVVIREFKSERGADGFSKTEQEQYRVLRLEQEGNGEYIYSVQVYTKGEKGNWVGGEEVSNRLQREFLDLYTFYICRCN